MLAHHYLEALRLTRVSGRAVPSSLTDKARLAARDAGDRALALAAFVPASRWYEAALELWPGDEPGRYELLLSYSQSRYDDTTLPDEVLEEATAGLLAAGNVEAAAQAQMLLGSTAWVRAERDTAFTYLERANSLLADRPPSAAKAYVLQKVARFAVLADDLDRATRLGTESLALATQFGLDEVRARNLNTLGMAKVNRGDMSGFEQLDQALELAHAVRSPDEAIAAGNIAWLRADAGDLRTAWEMHQKSVQIAARRGLDASIRWYRAERVYYNYWFGNWDEAVVEADRFIREVEAGAGHYMETYCRFLRSAIRYARGDQSGALTDAVRASEVARRAKDPQVLHPALAYEAHLLTVCDDRSNGSRVADELLAAWAKTGVWAQSESANGAWAFLALGRVDEFLEALGRAPYQTPWHAAARAIVAGDPAAAADIYAQIGSIPDECYARLRAAALLVDSGNRVEADRHLNTILPVYARLAASTYTAQAESLLAASA